MPNPTSSTTIQRPVLNQLFVEYMETAMTGLGGLQILPVFKTPKREPDVPVMPREAILKHPSDIKREQRGNYSRGDYEFETMTLRTEEYGYEEPVDDVERSMYSDYFSADEWAMRRATDILLRAQETRIKDAVFNTTTFTSYTGGITNEWDDASNCTPKADIDGIANTIYGNCGMYPTHLALPVQVFKNVLRSTELKGYLQYTSPHLMQGLEGQRQTLSAYLGVEVIVLGAPYDSAKEGQAASLANIWGTEYAMLFVRQDSADLRSPGLGRTFIWSADSPENINVESYREEQTRSDIIRVRQHCIEKVLKAEFGYLISNLTT